MDANLPASVTFGVAIWSAVLPYPPLSESCRVWHPNLSSGYGSKLSRFIHRSERRLEWEMREHFHGAICGAAVALILQLSVLISAQETTAARPEALGSFASTTSNIMVAESSQSLARSGTAASFNGVITEPGEAGDLGDPALGGQRHPLYRLSKLDTVEISFTFSNEFNQILTVQPDGFVTLKGAGTLFVEGLTIPEVRHAVGVAYRSFLREPEITVTLKEFDKPYFLASGEVARPGKYEMRGDLTVNEAVAMAGGFTNNARHSQVVLFRRTSSDVTESHVIDLKKMLNSRSLREDLHLRAGDFIFVPQSRISKIRKYVPASSLSWYMNPVQF